MAPKTQEVTSPEDGDEGPLPLSPQSLTGSRARGAGAEEEEDSVFGCAMFSPKSCSGSGSVDELVDEPVMSPLSATGSSSSSKQQQQEKKQQERPLSPNSIVSDGTRGSKRSVASRKSLMCNTEDDDDDESQAGEETLEEEAAVDNNNKKKTKKVAFVETNPTPLSPLSIKSDMLSPQSTATESMLSPRTDDEETLSFEDGDATLEEEDYTLEDTLEDGGDDGAKESLLSKAKIRGTKMDIRSPHHHTSTAGITPRTATGGGGGKGGGKKLASVNPPAIVNIPDDESEASMLVLMRYMGCTPIAYGKQGALLTGKEFVFDTFDDDDDNSLLSEDNGDDDDDDDATEYTYEEQQQHTYDRQQSERTAADQDSILMLRASWTMREEEGVEMGLDDLVLASPPLSPGSEASSGCGKKKKKTRRKKKKNDKAAEEEVAMSPPMSPQEKVEEILKKKNPSSSLSSPSSAHDNNMSPLEKLQKLQEISKTRKILQDNKRILSVDTTTEEEDPSTTVKSQTKIDLDKLLKRVQQEGSNKAVSPSVVLSDDDLLLFLASKEEEEEGEDGQESKKKAAKSDKTKKKKAAAASSIKSSRKVPMSITVSTSDKKVNKKTLSDADETLQEEEQPTDLTEKESIISALSQSALSPAVRQLANASSPSYSFSPKATPTAAVAAAADPVATTGIISPTGSIGRSPIASADTEDITKLIAATTAVAEASLAKSRAAAAAVVPGPVVALEESPTTRSDKENNGTEEEEANATTAATIAGGTSRKAHPLTVDTTRSTLSSSSSQQPLSPPTKKSVLEVDALLSKTRQWLIRHNESQMKKRAFATPTNNNGSSGNNLAPLSTSTSGAAASLAVRRVMGNITAKTVLNRENSSGSTSGGAAAPSNGSNAISPLKVNLSPKMSEPLSPSLMDQLRLASPSSSNKDDITANKSSSTGGGLPKTKKKKSILEQLDEIRAKQQEIELKQKAKKEQQHQRKETATAAAAATTTTVV